MKTAISIKNNVIKIKSPNLFFWILAIIGIVMSGTGVFLLASEEILGHLLLGFGIIFTSGGLFFYLNSEYYKIGINDPPGYITILESTIKAISPLKIPLNYYSGINIRGVMGKKGSASDESSYDVELISDMGTTLFLTECEDKDDALAMAETLQRLTEMEITLKNIPLPKIKKNGKKLLSIDLSSHKSIKTRPDGAMATLTWKSKYNPLHYLLICAILYGFFHLLYFVVTPAQESRIILYIAFCLFGLISVLSLVTMIFNLFSTYYCVISPGSITTFLGFFGKRISEKSFKSDDIGLIRNSANASNKNIQIISKEGLKIIDGIFQKLSTKGKPDISMLGDLMNFRDEVLELHTSSLTIGEKLYIEQMILEKML